MEKVWILKSKYSFKLCKNEADLLRRITKNSTQEILEFELKSSTSASDYLLSKERDIQLKSVLGELSDYEQNVNNLIVLYEELAPDGKEFTQWNSTRSNREKVTEKSSWISRLKKWQDNKTQFKNLLVDNKSYFLNLSSDKRWLVALLKCHNFVDCKEMKWDSNLRMLVDASKPELKESFRLAKLELKKSKK